MQTFTTHRGLLATLDRANVDTDQIIPKQFLKSIKRTGFGESLFYDWRYREDGTPDPDFELNDARFAGASILVARNNFGCGSSREHAVWAVMQAGFRVVIAPRVARDGKQIPGFADIFRNNAEKNGLLPVQLTEAEVNEIFEMVDRFPGLEATVDLEEQRIVLHMDEELAFHFELDDAVKQSLIRGLDEIAQTLEYDAEIGRFERDHDVQLTA
jgi:3-isopropylmalate/(R)-2-methylmalate dehydratase small subunit